MKIIQQTFKLLHEAKSIEDVNIILDKMNVEQKYRMDTKIYPQLNFSLSSNQIKALRSKKLLSKENMIMDVSKQDTLTKLLYAVAWKNGDLKKIRHIVEGIEHSNENKENALVFYQFGKYLTGKIGEPIIDQHVLRAYGLYKAIKQQDHDSQARLLKLSIITKKEKPLIKDYKNWLNSDLTGELRNCENYSYHVDIVLFAIGKKVKSEY